MEIGFVSLQLANADTAGMMDLYFWEIKPGDSMIRAFGLETFKIHVNTIGLIYTKCILRFRRSSLRESHLKVSDEFENSEQSFQNISPSLGDNVVKILIFLKEYAFSFIYKVSSTCDGKQ